MVHQLVWLLRAAGPQDWERQVSALSNELRHAFAAAPLLPAELIDAAIASGRQPLIESMCRATDPVSVEHAGLRARLAAGGLASVAEHAMHRWPLRDRRTVFAAADPADPEWAVLVDKLLIVVDPDRLRAAVTSPFPTLVEHVLRVAGPALTRAEHLRGRLSVATASGPPDDTLADLVAEAEATGGLIEELRAAAAGPLAEQVAWRTGLDWDAILAAHHDRPFGQDAAAGLAGRPDCPEPVLLALFAAHPLAVAEVARPTPGLVAAPLPERAAVSVARRRADGAIQAGLPADVLLRAVPAHAVLEALHRHRDAVPHVREELRWLVAERIGADPGRWRALRSGLKSHRGCIVDLLSVRDGPAVPWPDAKPMPELTERKPVTGVRAAFLTLLDVAPDAAHAALFEHMDDRTIYDLLSRGRWRDGWVDAAVASANPALRRSLAYRRDLAAAAVDRLAACDDTAVNGQLFLAENATMALRSRILSQRPFTPGRTEPVPLDPALREHLMRYTGGSGTSPYYAHDAIDCADLELQRHILRYRLIHGEIPQLRLVLNVWRRHGRAGVDDLLAATNGSATFRGRYLPAGLIKRVQRSLADPAELQDVVSLGVSAPAQIALLRGVSGPGSSRLRESHDWDWDAIRAEHAARPFPEDVLAAMCSRPGCPPWFAAMFASPLHAGLSRGVPPADLLAQAETHSGELARLVSGGRLQWADLFAHARPAGTALDVFDHVRAEVLPAGLAVLRTLVESTVDDRPDAWVMAVLMLPGFAGSLSELLFTATAAST